MQCQRSWKWKITVNRMIKYSIMREQLKYVNIVDIAYNADI